METASPSEAEEGPLGSDSDNQYPRNLSQMAHLDPKAGRHPSQAAVTYRSEEEEAAAVVHRHQSRLESDSDYQHHHNPHPPKADHSYRCSVEQLGREQCLDLAGNYLFPKEEAEVVHRHQSRLESDSDYQRPSG